MRDEVQSRPGISEFGRIDVSDLLRIVTVAHYGSISRSAVALNTSQPTLTRRIRRLETALGQDVLRRTGRGVLLTEFGRIVVEHGRAIEGALNAIAELAEANPICELRLGATHLAAGLIVPRVTRTLSATDGMPQMVVVEGTFETLQPQLQSGFLDLLLASPQIKAKQERSLEFEPLFWVHLGIVASRRHALASKANICLQDLANTNWVIFNGDASLNQRVETDLFRLGFRVPQCAQPLPSYSETLHFLRDNDAITVLPIEFLHGEPQTGDFVVLRGAWRFSRFPYGLFVRSCIKDNQMTRSFRAIVGKIVREIRLQSIQL